MSFTENMHPEEAKMLYIYLSLFQLQNFKNLTSTSNYHELCRIYSVKSTRVYKQTCIRISQHNRVDRARHTQGKQPMQNNDKHGAPLVKILQE